MQFVSIIGSTSSDGLGCVALKYQEKSISTRLTGQCQSRLTTLTVYTIVFSMTFSHLADALIQSDSYTSYIDKHMYSCVKYQKSHRCHPQWKILVGCNGTDRKSPGLLHCYLGPPLVSHSLDPSLHMKTPSLSVSFLEIKNYRNVCKRL